jgi:hypothetical protein
MSLQAVKRLAIGAGLVTWLTAVSTATTMANAASPSLSIGPTIEISHPALTVDAGSYRLTTLRVADPDGGPPWSFATYLANAARNSRRQLVCFEPGRVLDGRLGVVSDNDAFLPIAPAGGPSEHCGGVSPANGERASLYAITAAPAVATAGCLPTTSSPRPSRPCSLANMRTLIAVSLGRGITSAEVLRGGRAQGLKDGGEGTFLDVERGLFTDATMPTIRVHATICGPDARTDLAAKYSSHRIGRCSVAYDIPDGPRPASESVASKRARRAKRLDASVSVRKRAHSVAIDRFVARVIVPITVEDSTEGYAYRLKGPGGPNCRRTRVADASHDPISSYLMIAGKPYDLPILPLEPRNPRWCKGTYTLEILFAQRARSATPRWITKHVATTTFRVTR